MFRPLRWIGSAKRDFAAMPEAVQASLSLVLVAAQMGTKHAKARALGGCGDAGILEVIEEHCGNTYWAVYSVRYVDTVYVLHCQAHSSRHGGTAFVRDLREIKTGLKIVELFKRGG